TSSTSPSNPAVAAQVAGFYAQGQATVPDDDDGTQVPVPTAVSRNGSNCRRADARGTVCIPANYLRNAGFKPKDKACVYIVAGDCLEVVAKGPAQSPAPAAFYTVDENNNVRIT